MRPEQATLAITFTGHLNSRTPTNLVSRRAVTGRTTHPYHLRNYIDVRYGRACRPRISGLARLDVRVSAWTARWRDHFLLMASLRVRDFRVNALISDRRGRNQPLCSAGGAVPCSSSVPGGSLPCGMFFSTVSCVSPLEAAKAVSGTKQKPRKISAAPVVQLTAHARAILVQSYLQYRFCWRFLIRWIECRRAPQVSGEANSNDTRWGISTTTAWTSR